MAGAEPARRASPAPALAATYEGDTPALLERLLPLVDAIELTPDSIACVDGRGARLRREVVDEYASALPAVQLVAHGVGLSIGSFDTWNERYLRLLDEVVERFALEWHSEHLAYTTVAGENLGTMLPLPRTEEALDLVCERVRLVQERYRLPFLIEHVVQLLPDAPADYTPAGFLNALTSRTGCGLILDAYNLECDAHNGRLDLDAFLGELDLSPVRELHLAGGVRHRGFQLDIHSRRTCDATLALARDLVRRAPCLRMVTYEFLKEAVAPLGQEAICAEIQRIRREVLS